MGRINSDNGIVNFTPTIGASSKTGSYADLLSQIPGFLGYWPKDSLVVAICLAEQVELTARVNINWFADDYLAVADQFNEITSRYPDAEYYLLGYCTDRELAEMSLSFLAETLSNVNISDILITDGHYWWSLMCNESCCPQQGRPFNHFPVELSEKITLSGEVSAGGGAQLSNDRETLVTALQGPQETDNLETFLAAKNHISALSRQKKWDEWRKLITLDELDQDQAIYAAALLQDAEVMVDFGSTLNVHTAQRTVNWLRQVIARCPAQDAANMLALIGLAAWLARGGPVLSVAAQRLNLIDRQHPMNKVLQHLIKDVVTPYI